MGSSVELAAVLTPSAIDEIDWIETKKKKDTDWSQWEIRFQEER